MNEWSEAAIPIPVCQMICQTEQEIMIGRKLSLKEDGCMQ